MIFLKKIFFLGLFLKGAFVLGQYQLVMPSYEEDPLTLGSWHGSVFQTLKHPLKVRVLNEKKEPVSSVEVEFFEATSSPSGLTFSQQKVQTDAKGWAQTKVTLGSKPGTFVVGAQVTSSSKAHSSEIFWNLSARKKGWGWFLLMELMAGLALFMFGIHYLSEGMKKSTGTYLREMMTKLTKNRFLALIVGAFITVVFQSSTATTVMLVGFAQAGILNSVQSLGLLLGADIGTTMTVQLIAFKITDYIMIAISIGYLMMCVCKKESMKFAGQGIMGLGILFFGMGMMSQSMDPLRYWEPFLLLMSSFDNIIAGIVLGTLMSALLHSAATIAIVIIFASQGLIGLETGIAFCLGANIGTCFTAVLASLKAGKEAKRVAAAHVIFKIAGVLLLVFWIPYFAQFIQSISLEASMARQIANAHTVFNIGIAIVFLPFLKPFGKLVQILVQEKVKKEKLCCLDDTLVKTPALALMAAKAEIKRLGFKAQHMLDESFSCVFKSCTLNKELIYSQENHINQSYNEIKLFLTQVLSGPVAQVRSQEAFQMMRFLGDLEQIGDIVQERIVPQLLHLQEQNFRFSPEGLLELQDYHTKTLKQMSRAMEVFGHVSLEKAQHLSQRFEDYRQLAHEFQQKHFNRLTQRVKESAETSDIHLELLSALLEISDLSTNIARYLLQGAQKKDLPKEISSKSLIDNV